VKIVRSTPVRRASRALGASPVLFALLVWCACSLADLDYLKKGSSARDAAANDAGGADATMDGHDSGTTGKPDMDGRLEPDVGGSIVADGKGGAGGSTGVGGARDAGLDGSQIRTSDASDVALGGAPGGASGTGDGGGGVTGGSGGGGIGGAGGKATGGTGAGGVASGGVGGTGGVGGGLSAGLVAYYPCDQTAGNTLLDLSGKARNAVLSGGYSFARGEVNNALDLQVAARGYATIPTGVLFGAAKMTVATWVYFNSVADWARVWDFGRDTSYNMFLTYRSGTSPRLHFGITTNGASSAQTMDADGGPPVKQWIHLAVVLDDGGAALYVNGQKKGSSSAITLRPKDLGDTTNNYIGKSQYASDPYFDGNIDEFRVYDRALSATELAALASGS